MAFEKVTQAKFKKKSSSIADQLLMMINAGRFPVGSRLPSERIMAEQMGVSRPSLREAISALQIAGILESRPGDGTYVSAPGSSEENIKETFSVLEECDSPYENLLARKAFEIGVAKLAIEVAQDEDLLAIKEAWEEKCRRGREGTLEDYLLYGKAFHLAIARATRNRVIEAVTERLLDLSTQPLWIKMRREYFQKDISRIELMLDIHSGIVEALISRDTERVIRELEHHYDIQIEQIYYQGEGSLNHSSTFKSQKEAGK